MSARSKNKNTILQALATSAQRWRTAASLSKETGIALDDVQKILDRTPEIVTARKGTKTGQALFALEEKDPRVTARSHTAQESPVPQDTDPDPDTAGRGAVTYLVLLPFDASMKRLRDASQRTLREAKARVLFASDAAAYTHGGALWFDELSRMIRQSDVVIADYSRKNPNVLFELGMAHGLGKPLILLMSEEADMELPASLVGFQIVTYNPANLTPFVERIGRIARHQQGRIGTSR